jgi:hypothetical protein
MQYYLIIFSDDGPMLNETYRKTQCYNIIYISKQEHRAFCRLKVVNRLWTMHGTNNIYPSTDGFFGPSIK